MKTCFNEATTMKNSTLEKDLILCEKYGYDYIEIRLDKLREYLVNKTVTDLESFFSRAHIKPYAFNALEFITFRDEESYSKIQADLKFLCETGQRINCRKIVVVPTFDVGDKTRGEIAAESVRRLRELSDIAAGYEMNLAFEFVGYPNCSVNSFEDAYNIVKTTNRKNVGIVLDCFHFYAMKSCIKSLEEADAEKIFILHVDDCEDLPQGWLRDYHRVWPGTGIIDLKTIFRMLGKIGYREMASLELFRPEYYAMSAEKTISIGKRYLDVLLSTCKK